jgi:His/Glu/Gln/Arg/opine family amino acid ABC transporter permease subunit
LDRIVDNYFNAAIMAQALPAMLQGFWTTVQVAICVIVVGILLGLALAIVRCMPNRLATVPVAIFSDIFRTLPQVVIMIILYFGLPYAGWAPSPFTTTVMALGAVLAAFSAETFYASIQALPKGQWDAASALGLRPTPVMFLVILPQAMRLATPLLTNRAIAITKGTALGSAVALPEILSSAQSAMAIMANPSPLTLAAAFYLCFFIPLVILSRIVEWRVGTRGAGVA